MYKASISSEILWLGDLNVKLVLIEILPFNFSIQWNLFKIYGKLPLVWKGACVTFKFSSTFLSYSEYSSFCSVQLLSCVWLFLIPWTAASQTSLCITNFQSLLKLLSIKLVMPSEHLILCHSLFLLPSIFPSIRVSSNESALCIRWPKDWSFSFSISPSNEYSGLISFRMDWLDLLAVQGTLKGLLQHHSSKVSILQCSAFFMSNSLSFL